MKPLLGLVALAAAGFLVLAFLAKPDYGRPPRLAAVIDGGKMEELLETAEERETILRWVNDGAPERDWPRVESVFEDRCTTCHHSDASFEFLPLDNYSDAARAAEVLPVLEEKISGGTMGEYLESPEAHKTLVDWIDAGAPELEWPTAKAALDAHCVHCHNPEGVQGIVSLDSYRPAARLASLPPTVPRPIVAPGLVLFASLSVLAIYGRRDRSSRSSPGPGIAPTRTS